MTKNKEISDAMTIKLEDILGQLPEMPEFEKGMRRAPKRSFTLNQKKLNLP